MEKDLKKVIEPDYYNKTDISCIDAMIAAKGLKKTIAFCDCCAFKYEWRLGQKDLEEKEIGKIKWYLDKYLELSKILKDKEEKESICNTNDKNAITWGNKFATYAYVVCKKDYNPCRNIEFKEGELYQLKKEEGVMYLFVDGCAYHTTQKVLDEYFDLNVKQ